MTKPTYVWLDDNTVAYGYDETGRMLAQGYWYVRNKHAKEWQLMVLDDMCPEWIQSIRVWNTAHKK